MPVKPQILIQQGADQVQLERLFVMRDLLNAYVVKNILLVGQSSQARVESFINPNLYRISVEYYGSVDFWPVIAKANNLTDPSVTGAVTLLIPPKPSIDPRSILNP